MREKASARRAFRVRGEADGNTRSSVSKMFKCEEGERCATFRLFCRPILGTLQFSHDRIPCDPFLHAGIGWGAFRQQHC